MSGFTFVFPLTIPFSIPFILSFLLGRIGSLWLYQVTWNNGIERRFHLGGAMATLLSRPWLWLVHIPVMALSSTLDWESLPKLHLYICVAAGCLALAAIGRMGAVDLKRWFIFDRCLVGIIWLGLWLSPVFLYPLLLACCCLQYIVSGSTLSPGYSNLLGFEFMRSSLCLGLATLLIQAGLQLLEWQAFLSIDLDAQVLGIVLCGQAAGYVQQAIAKSTLGKHWYSWILENRLQCLVVNAWLRGWCATWMSIGGILSLAKSISRVRILLCAAAWIIEISWILILVDARLAQGILAATTLFHFAVWVLTGLIGYHYIISHLLMLSFAATPSALKLFKPEFALVGFGCILFSSVLVLLLRRTLFREYTRTGSAGHWGRLADPADHLMSWWDGPYMRLYSYSVKTSSGRCFSFPVTGFSPYDTFLTDIHTHLMILGKSWNLDPQLDVDREIIKIGVWGLTLSLEDRDRVYALMDNPKADLRIFNRDSRQNKFLGEFTKTHADAQANLTKFFQGINFYQSKWWFKILLLCPHFPGEDRVPDWSPLATEYLPRYTGAEPITEVTCYCLKTFYQGDAIQRVEERAFAQFRINEDSIPSLPRASLLPFSKEAST
jgi:hypothetical protein